MEVWILVGVVIVLRLAGVVVARLVRSRSHPARPPVSAADPCLSPVFGLPPAGGPDPERVLLERLMAGRLSRDDYRSAMAELARRDELLHRPRW